MKKQGKFALAFVLSIVSFLSPVASPQEADTAPDVVPDQTDPTVDPGVKEPVPIDKGGGQAAAMSGGTGGSGAANTGSTTGGQPIANAFNFQTDLITGRFSYSVPIVVAPGRQGAQPRLALAYNSSGGNGWCGVGWNLDVGFIQRDTRRGVPVAWGATNALAQYDDAKCFVANFGGVNACLVLANVGNPAYTFEYRAEVDGAFLKYLYYTNSTDPYWQVIDKGSNSFFFGRTSSSRMQNSNTAWNAPNQGKAVFRWALDKVVDVNGNETIIDYTTDANLLYLSKITYNGNVNDGTITARNTVDFELIGRTDKTISFQPGYRVETTKLLSNIVVKANGSMVRRYALAYASSPSTLRALLNSVTMFGSDGTSTLPPQSFSYQVKPFEFGAAQAWSGVNDLGGSTAWGSVRAMDSGLNHHVELMDIDGDGLPDRVMRKYSSPYTYFVTQRNTNGGFAATNAWGPLDSQGRTDIEWNSIRSIDGSKATLIDLMDVDGDGFPDRVMRKYASPYTNFFVQFNLGSPYSTGFSTANVWMPVDSASTAQDWRSIRYGQYVKVDMIDMDGDGLPDRVVRKDSNPYDRFYVQLNTKSGFTGLKDWKTLYSEAGQSSETWHSIYAVDDDSDTYAGLYDINGDGLPDRVMRKDNSPYTNYFQVQFNNGAGFETNEQWSVLNSQGETASSWNSPSANDNGGETFNSLVDINGDGLLDRVMRKNSGTLDVFRVQLNTGSGFSINVVDWGPITNLNQSGDGWVSVRGEDNNLNTFNDLVDINGDGLPDRVMRDVDGTYDQFWVQLNKGPAPDLMYEIRNGLGGTVSVAYRPSTQYDNRNKDWAAVGDPWKTNAVSKLPFPVWTVSSTKVFDGMGTEYNTTYAYKGGFFDLAKREFRGFNQTTVTDPLGAKTITYFHQSGGRDESANGEFEDQASKGKKGLPYKVEVYGTNNALYAVTLNKVEEALLNTNGWCFPYISQTIQMAYEGLGTYRATAVRLFYDTNNGNVLLSTNLGEVSGVNFATHAVNNVDTSDDLYTITTYTNIGDIKDKPLAITISASSSGSPALRQTIFKYDGRGNLTEGKAWLDTAGAYVTNTIIAYDSVGNPTQSTGAAGITVTTTYDSSKTFPVKSVTGSFTNETLADVRSGAVVWTKDPNGLTATNLVDVFFRTTETRVSTNSTSGPTLWRTKTDYSLLGTGGTNGLTTNYVRQRVYEANDTSNGIESYGYTDGLGRGIQTRAESETNGVFRVSDVFFDGRGSVAFGTLPYFSSGSGFTLSTSTTRLGTYTDYDPIGRPQIVTPAVQATFSSAGKITSVSDTGGDTDSPVDSTTTYFFDGTNPWAKSVVDAEGKTSKSFFDGFGRITQIVNVVSGGNITTYFKYDPVANLTNVTDHAGNITRIVYDSLGRKTSMTDPDMGTWSYAYDKAGRLTNQVDAKSQKTAFTFNDQLGRLTKKDVYNASGTLAYSATYAYDTNVSGFTGWKGAMTGLVDKEGWVRTGFDERGRATNSSRYLSKNTTTYTISTKYDDANNVTEVRYPTTTTVRIGYAYTNGILYRVKSIEGTGSTNEVFYQLGSLNELGQAVNYTTHSGKVTNTYTFFDNSKRLKTMKAARSAAGLQNLAYKFDKVSNIKGIIDSQYSGTCAGSISNLVYDDLHRLTSLSHAGGSRTYAYNALGNMLTNSDSGTAQYKYGSKPHAVTNANGTTYSYDSNGNMITRGGDTLSYDEENRLIQADASSTSFGYADGGARLWKQPAVGGLQVWIGGIYEEKAGKQLCHVFAGQRLATFEPASGGPYASIWAPKTLWAHATETFVSATSWPFQHNRTPATVLVTTLLAVLILSITARRGWRWNPNAWILRTLTRVLPLLGERAGVRAGQKKCSSRGHETLIFAEENSEPPHVGCNELTNRERRWFTQPFWRQAVSVVMMVALVFTTTPTDVQAQTYTPVFYYYVGDHLGSSNVMTDRNGVLVEHYEYTAFGNVKGCTANPSAFQVSNRYTGQVLDEETGLYYYNARYYDPVLGRFIQADTIVPGAADPQNLNRYSYVNNNPLKYTDPTGHEGFFSGLGTSLGNAFEGAVKSPQFWTSVAIMGPLAPLMVVEQTTTDYINARLFGPKTSYHMAIARTIVLALAMIIFGGPVGWVTGALTLASVGAALAGNENLSENLAWAAFGVGLAGTVYGMYQASQASNQSDSSTTFTTDKSQDTIPGRPGRSPTAEEAAVLKENFPNINIDDVRVTDVRVTDGSKSAYNCFAVCLGLEDRDVIPPHAPGAYSTLAEADDFFGGYGFKNTERANADVALFATPKGVTHGAKHLGGGWWDSKLGPEFRITHRLGQLEGGKEYGNVVRYYSIPK